MRVEGRVETGAQPKAKEAKSKSDCCLIGEESDRLA